jgi:hypothetical protein
MRTPTSFVLRKLTLLLVPDAACFVPRVLCRPSGGRMNGDRRILVGTLNLNVGLRHVTFEQKQPLGTGVHSVELPDGISTRSMERRGRNSYVNIAEAVASFRRLLDHSTVHLLNWIVSLICFRPSGFGFTLRRGSCVADPSIRFARVRMSVPVPIQSSASTVVASRIRRPS